MELGITTWAVAQRSASCPRTEARGLSTGTDMGTQLSQGLAQEHAPAAPVHADDEDDRQDQARQRLGDHPAGVLSGGLARAENLQRKPQEHLGGDRGDAEGDPPSIGRISLEDQGEGLGQHQSEEADGHRQARDEPE